MSHQPGTQDEAHVVRFEIPPMMRYCAGTCPCTWVTAVALPNLALLRQSLRITHFNKEGEVEVHNIRPAILTGEDRKEEIKFLKYLLPAQSMMGLSSYFAWYYGYGFYGPAKYPLLLYGLTLACHSAAHEGDILSNPNFVLGHRAACAISTFLCSCCFFRLSKFASLLMLPACGIYACLTNVTMQGINSGNVNMNAVGNVNNNQERTTQQDILEQQVVDTRQNRLTTMKPHQQTQLTLPPKRRRKKNSILKIEENKPTDPLCLINQRNARQSMKSYVSFNDTVGVKYRNPSLSTSCSSSSLTSSVDNEENE